MADSYTDLHSHTNNSDGTDTTYEIVEKFKKANIKFFSITDHDDLTSCKEMEEIFLPEDMRYITGIELSAIHKGYNCHILGYGFDHNNTSLLAECRFIKTKRKKKIIQVLEYIRENLVILPEEKKREILNKKGTVGRYDICKVLMKELKLDRKEIYEKYLSPKDLIVHRSDSQRIIDVIHDAKGAAILAHPKEIEEDYNIDIEKFIKSLIYEGLDGIEIYNSIHTLEDVRRYQELARKYNLFTTCGSDYHGTNKPEIKIGKTTKEYILVKESDIFFPY